MRLTGTRLIQICFWFRFLTSFLNEHCYYSINRSTNRFDWSINRPVIFHLCENNLCYSDNYGGQYTYSVSLWIVSDSCAVLSPFVDSFWLSVVRSSKTLNSFCVFSIINFVSTLSFSNCFCGTSFLLRLPAMVNISRICLVTKAIVSSISSSLRLSGEYSVVILSNSLLNWTCIQM